MDDSIDLVIEMLLDVVRAKNSQTLLEAVECTTGVESKETPLPMEQFTLLPLQQPSDATVHKKERRPPRGTTKQRTPQAPGLPAPSVVSGQTPRTTTQKPVQTHVDRCKNCVGIYMAKVESSGVVDGSQKKRREKKKRKKADSRTRRNCEHCGKRTDYMCLGCRRFCCFSLPSETKSGKKHPKYFSVQTPIIDRRTGELRRTRKNRDLVLETTVCTWTCYHALHREAWVTYTEANKHKILAMAQGDRTKVKKAQKKRKKGILKTIREGRDEDNSEGESEEESDDSESDDNESGEESGSESDEDSDSESDDDDSDEDDNDQNDSRIAIKNKGRKRGRSNMSKS